jgi:membrane fusion protein (multidrug efflux system)
VGVVTVTTQPVPLVTELPGRLEASRVAQVRARATGIVQKRLFREGSDVKAGQVLFQIDAAPYQAAWTAPGSAGACRGQLVAGQAQASATSRWPRPRPISQQEYANAQAAQKQAEADVAAGTAPRCMTARINLGYATVKAPIGGPHRPRAGDRRRAGGPGRGHADGADPAGRPAVRQLHPVGVRGAALAQGARRRPAQARRRQQRGRGARGAGRRQRPTRKRQAAVQSDLAVDAATGQVSLRAELPNPQGLLLPGLYVQGAAGAGPCAQAIKLPQQAVMRSRRRATRCWWWAPTASGAAAGQVVAAQGNALGGARWPEGRRAGDGRRLPEDDVPGAPVNPVPWSPRAGRRRRSRGQVPRGGAPPRPRPWPPAAEDALPWPVSSSTGRSLPGSSRCSSRCWARAAINKLPVAQYPTVAPPAIVITAAYPGASAKVLEDSVLSVIEQELNGAPGLIYMESVAQANGAGAITATFEPGTDADLAQIEVQNRLSRATPRLPAAVVQQGVRVDKARSNFLLFVSLTSSNPADDPVAWATTPRATSSPSCSAFPAWARRSCSAPSAPCASGSTRPSCRASACSRPMSTTHPGAERPGVGRHPGRTAQRARPADERHRGGQRPAGQCRAVRRHRAARQHRRQQRAPADVARIELGAQGYGSFSRLNGQPAPASASSWRPPATRWPRPTR